MLFQLTSITSLGEWRDFFLYDEDLERVYTLLQGIYEQDDSLLAVSLIDSKGHLTLPLEKLDDPLFANPIQALRQQWESLLTPLADVYSTRGQFRHQLRAERISALRRALLRTQALEERACQSLSEGPSKTRLLAYYTDRIDQYRRRLFQLETASSNSSD